MYCIPVQRRGLQEQVNDQLLKLVAGERLNLLKEDLVV
jgi:hypothetical protein